MARKAVRWRKLCVTPPRWRPDWPRWKVSSQRRWSRPFPAKKEGEEQKLKRREEEGKEREVVNREEEEEEGDRKR